MVQQAGSFELTSGLAVDHAQGRYQGLYGTLSGAARALAPGVLTLLCVNGGALGWIAVGGIFAAAGCVMPLAVRAGGVRQPDPDPVDVVSDGWCGR
ncbi:hypothetical protein [Kitasatospora mediocidica]|uniref:hypothetical protein n=1 Tax=Kitasatospora mediocidica TaxID=58352 RepID=UPI00055BCD02|nr:hypothetical protein [Kitasatospora mediocidica]